MNRRTYFKALLAGLAAPQLPALAPLPATNGKLKITAVEIWRLDGQRPPPDVAYRQLRHSSPGLPEALLLVCSGYPRASLPWRTASSFHPAIPTPTIAESTLHLGQTTIRELHQRLRKIQFP